MKLLFFSDVHGSPESVELLLKQADLWKPELLVLLGDVLYHGPRNPLKPDYAPQRVAGLLNPLREKIVAVRGNCDSEVDQMMLEFPIMSDFAEIVTSNTRFFLTHGHLWNQEHLPPVPDQTIIAHGHTHIPTLKSLECGITIFNPGSISLPKNGHPPTFGWFDGRNLSIHRLDDGNLYDGFCS